MKQQLCCSCPQNNMKQLNLQDHHISELCFFPVGTFRKGLVTRVIVSEGLWPQTEQRHQWLQSARGTKSCLEMHFYCFFSPLDEPCHIQAKEARQEQRNSIWSWCQRKDLVYQGLLEKKGKKKYSDIITLQCEAWNSTFNKLRSLLGAESYFRNCLWVFLLSITEKNQ